MLSLPSSPTPTISQSIPTAFVTLTNNPQAHIYHQHYPRIQSHRRQFVVIMTATVIRWLVTGSTSLMTTFIRQKCQTTLIIIHATTRSPFSAHLKSWPHGIIQICLLLLLLLTWSTQTSTILNISIISINDNGGSAWYQHIGRLNT